MPPGARLRDHKSGAIGKAKRFIPLEHDVEPAVRQMPACRSQDDPTEKVGVVGGRSTDPHRDLSAEQFCRCEMWSKSSMSARQAARKSHRKCAISNLFAWRKRSRRSGRVTMRANTKLHSSECQKLMRVSP